MMNLNGVRNFRHHRRLPSSDRFLDIFSPPKPSSAVADDLTESDVLWTVSDSTRDSPSTQIAHRKLGLRLPDDGARPRAIPKPTREVDQRRRMMTNSAPVDVPQAMRKVKRFSELENYYEDDDDDDDESDEEDEMLPPHEIVARKVKATSSVLEGVGRTLKGRDLRRVRDAVWRQSGFID